MRWVALDWIDPRYEVSDTGKVRSWAIRNGKGTGLAPYPRLRKEGVTKAGYLQVSLPSVGYSRGFRNFLVHRLILRAFRGDSTLQCNHKDGNRGNNRLGNLEWCSMSENMKHAYHKLGRVHPRAMLGKFGKDNACSKRVAQLSKDGRVVRVWHAMQDAKREGFSQGSISLVCRGERKTHKGYIWKFI